MMIQQQIANATLALLAIVCSYSCNIPPKAGKENTSPDVIVYGATPSGIMSATAANREGSTVLILEPGAHIGGMVAGGLGRTDIGNKESIGGMAAAFFNEVAGHTPKPLQTPGRPWDLEAKVAMRVFHSWIDREHIRVERNKRIISVTKSDNRITAVRLEDGSVYKAKMFIDATYEGDLLALAGISYTVGRESSDQYLENVAGFYQKPKILYHESIYCKKDACVGGSKEENTHYLHDTQFGSNISAYDTKKNVLWGINPDAKRQAGSGDSLIQAYCFRLTATMRKDVMVPWPKPENYYPERYELLLRYIKAHPCITITKLMHPGALPNGKFDINATGPFTTDYVGGNTAYPGGDHATRQRIIQDHEDYQKGFFWFLANDERVPSRLRMEAREWGLCSDEFTDNGHWPHQLYIREARRMVGSYVMKLQDITTDVHKADAVGMGSFIADSHPVQRLINSEGFVEEEGHLGENTQPYTIPYRSIIPKKEECQNLLVPVCLSATHVAYGSIRMEPVYMLLGQAAGTAASMAAKANINIQDINVEALQKTLLKEGQVLPAN